MPSHETKSTIAFVTVGVVIVLVITAIAILYTRRRAKNLLPVTEMENPETTFVQRHINGIRAWTKPANMHTDRLGQPVKVDPRHRSLGLAQPATSHQPTRPTHDNFSMFPGPQKTKHQEEHDRAVGQASAVSSTWPYQPTERPKGAAYWARVGREMAANRTWRDKVRDKLGM
ncbi:hypothetical protein CC86DRAFT_373946 [Ophiobolus disseminans]|uniref:Uncharacterized protein n=1 Tax=Ophiobolus disseminans TaxID=1469910 RepID=A0A6A6ZJ81_9PLEO|nr:hypothetical protein CC86DRAFT_373946 [Ophiobolus disseminans]